ncbi:glycosyltransferase family 2 protein [Ramlibacter ginsenosidimutans]|uniref:Glycosyltransferase family 2 protein n=2 Tax=Ramlibacter ginsenosidimutans TaxID=502333 RepID=A0A934TR27_9BURK|nr:glycosyltransferase family 2 protein [Ramlibacter ginsenosidimutans]MBK6005760.1 glycosyltransferase family 2 protein [Ramlibacter ginsenosidimutans]
MHAAEGAARPLLFTGIATQDVAAPFRAQDALELTILMPCLNEAKTVAACVEAALGFLERAGIRGEVVVADNGSTDGSRELARSAGARVIAVPDRGYGAALKGGIEAARGAYVIMGDADCSYDFSNLDAFVEQLRGGARLVMGNRFRGGIAEGAMPLLHRYLGNPVLSFIGRLFFRTDIGDFHCGIRGFHQESVAALGLVSNGMEFASEMVAKAALAGISIAEVPTTLKPDGRGRPPHLRTWRDGWRHLKFLLLFCPRWLFLYPGVMLVLAGVVGMGVLQRPWSSDAHDLRIHTMLYMAGAMVLGVQLVQLAVLTKWLGVLSGIVPQPPWLRRAQPALSLEAGLLLGAGLFAIGLIWSVGLVQQWGRSGFGPLAPTEGMRAAIPAVTLMIIGMQAVAGTLFAGAIELAWRTGRQKRHA